MKGFTMSNLLEIKEQIKKFYAKFEIYLIPVLKFILAFAVFMGIKSQLGYMTRINNVAILLIAALLCSFLPLGFTIFFSAIFILLHCYALALEALLVVACLFIILLLLFFRFSPKDVVCVLLTPLCFALKIPYVMPLAMGLISTPLSAISVGCGTVLYYFLGHISRNAQALGAAEATEATARIRIMIDGLIGNKAMIIMVVAFAFTVALVYIVRRMSIDHSWTIAIISGTIINVMILLLGDLMYDTNVSIVGVIFGSMVSALLAVVLQFFVFSVDYSRTEKVQFEDDEYYYYVKAVPKMTVATPEKNIKKINSQVGHAIRTERTGHVTSQPERTARTAPRREEAERTGTQHNSAQRTNAQRVNAQRSNAQRVNAQRGNAVRKGSSMTITPRREIPTRTDDFEEI